MFPHYFRRLNAKFNVSRIKCYIDINDIIHLYNYLPWAILLASVSCEILYAIILRTNILKGDYFLFLFIIIIISSHSITGY